MTDRHAIPRAQPVRCKGCGRMARRPLCPTCQALARLGIVTKGEKIR